MLVKSESGDRFLNMFIENNCNNTINMPTRVTSDSATLIDHFWTNNLNSLHKNGIILEFFSDHFPIFFNFQNSK